jgi:hypothetical protein
MRRLFEVFLALFGVIVIGISLAHFALGPDAIIGGSHVNATSDGEDRFFAGLVFSFGVALVWCSREAERKRIYINLLAAVFFVGGVGRLISLVVVGAPHPFYIAMLVLELGLPPVMVVAAKRVAEPAPQAR